MLTPLESLFFPIEKPTARRPDARVGSTSKLEVLGHVDRIWAKSVCHTALPRCLFWRWDLHLMVILVFMVLCGFIGQKLTLDTMTARLSCVYTNWEE